MKANARLGAFALVAVSLVLPVNGASVSRRRARSGRRAGRLDVQGSAAPECRAPAGRAAYSSVEHQRCSARARSGQRPAGAKLDVPRFGHSDPVECRRRQRHGGRSPHRSNGQGAADLKARQGVSGLAGRLSRWTPPAGHQLGAEAHAQEHRAAIRTPAAPAGSRSLPR